MYLRFLQHASMLRVLRLALPLGISSEKRLARIRCPDPNPDRNVFLRLAGKYVASLIYRSTSLVTGIEPSDRILT